MILTQQNLMGCMKTKELNEILIETLSKQQMLIRFCEDSLDYIFKESGGYLRDRFNEILDGEDYHVLSLKQFVVMKEKEHKFMNEVKALDEE